MQIKLKTEELKNAVNKVVKGMGNNKILPITEMIGVNVETKINLSFSIIKTRLLSAKKIEPNIMLIRPPNIVAPIWKPIVDALATIKTIPVANIATLVKIAINSHLVAREIYLFILSPPSHCHNIKHSMLQ